jgi:hypothetical protein
MQRAHQVGIEGVEEEAATLTAIPRTMVLGVREAAAMAAEAAEAAEAVTPTTAAAAAAAVAAE